MEKIFEVGSVIKKGRFTGKIIKIEPRFTPHARGGLYTQYVVEGKNKKGKTKKVYEVYEGEKIPFRFA